MTDKPEASANSDFALTDGEAKLKFEQYQSLDPFPDIPPALLNSADVADYARVTGMLWPFRLEKRKSASYEIPLLGKCVFWDDTHKKQVEQIVGPDDKFVLKANSIAFVTLEPMFRLPHYMALRFNLKISHIYKGILLGTGPLVDPGFEGKLSIPLHNLTTNDYTFKAGDGLIWMEFTKVSPNDKWHKDDTRTDRRGDYKGFPPEKNELEDVEDYIEKAVGREGKVLSSIPEAAAAATKAAGQVESIRGQIRKAGYISAGVAFVVIFLPLYFGFYQIHSLVSDSHTYVSDARKEIDSLNRKFNESAIMEQQLDIELELLGLQLQQIESRTADKGLKSELERLRSRLLELNSKRNAERAK